MPSKLPPTPFLTTPDSNYRNRISDKVAWLQTANTTNVWTAWAWYHSERSHHKIVGMDSLSVNHIKRVRCCIQVAAFVMFSLLTWAHKKSGGKGPMLQWLKNQIEESEMCHYYWYIIIDLMLNLLIFVRSIKEGNLSLYVSSLKQVVKWYYSCDHYHYACWVTFHLYDLVHLYGSGSWSTYMIWSLHHPTCTTSHEQHYMLWSLHHPTCFSDGYFAFQKSKNFFLLDGDWPGSWAE